MLLSVACASLLALSSPGIQLDTAPMKVRVLILDGQNNHDWRKTTDATRATLPEWPSARTPAAR